MHHGWGIPSDSPEPALSNGVGLEILKNPCGWLWWQASEAPRGARLRGAFTGATGAPATRGLYHPAAEREGYRMVVFVSGSGKYW